MGFLIHQPSLAVSVSQSHCAIHVPNLNGLQKLSPLGRLARLYSWGPMVSRAFQKGEGPQMSSVEDDTAIHLVKRDEVLTLYCLVP